MTETTTGRRYVIRVQGRLAPHWRHWFDGMQITTVAARDETLIAGPIPDQAALFGLLDRIRDSGIPLIGLMPAEGESP